MHRVFPCYYPDLRGTIVFRVFTGNVVNVQSIFGTTPTFRIRLCSESSCESRECTGYFLNRYNPDCAGYTNCPSLPGSDKYTGVFLGTILAVRVRQRVRVLLKLDEYKGVILGTALSVGYPNVISFLNNHINIRLFPW